MALEAAPVADAVAASSGDPYCPAAEAPLTFSRQWGCRSGAESFVSDEV